MSTARWRLEVVAVVILAALVWAAPVGAQEQEKPSPAPSGQPTASSPALGIGGRAGWLRSDDADDTNLHGGAQLRLRLLPILGLEGSIDYRKEEFDNGRIEIKSYPVLVSALLYPIPTAPIQPYLIGGVGWYFNRIEIEGGRSDETQRFGVHIGPGIDIPITPQVVLNGDIRWYFLDVDSKRVREARRRDLDTDGWLATVGVTFYFR